MYKLHSTQKYRKNKVENKPSNCINMEMASQRTVTLKQMPVNPIPYSFTTKYDSGVQRNAKT